MKIVTSSPEAIVIEQPTDIYPALDWLHSQMCERMELAKATRNVQKWERAAAHLSKLMDITEDAGFGNMDNVDSIDII